MVFKCFFLLERNLHICDFIEGILSKKKTKKKPVGSSLSDLASTQVLLSTVQNGAPYRAFLPSLKTYIF